MKTTSISSARLSTPIGDLLAVVQGDELLALAFVGRWDNCTGSLDRRFGHHDFPAAKESSEPLAELSAYFTGDLAALDRIKVDAPGTPFQKSVWDALRRIPVGSTMSYSGLAEKIGKPAAVRAVAAANACNPVAVVVPCHRVIAKTGGLHGYGGGLERKHWLLVHEGALLA
jgi:methylated-DNA-[protein]-cysteine S-methyltransferase